MRDFADEVPGYLHNRAMGAALDQLDIKSGIEHLGRNMRLCYETLIASGWVGQQELPLLEAWLADLAVASTT